MLPRSLALWYNLRANNVRPYILLLPVKTEITSVTTVTAPILRWFLGAYQLLFRYLYT